MINAKATCTFIVLIAILLGLPAAAAEPTLKEIMQGLRDDLLEMTDGLLLEDPDRVSRAAAGIASHDPISEREKTIIAQVLGPEMQEFGRLDKVVHGLSISISEVALKGDQARIEREYQQMLSACLACHTAYKARVSNALEKVRETSKLRKQP